MNHQINVFCGLKHVGIILVNFKTDQAEFQYDESWIHEGFPLSPHLDWNKNISSISIKNFIENLLPEGDGLDYVSRFVQISKRNKFALIAKIGSETAGALTFTLNNILPETSLRYISKEELSARIKERRTRSINVWDEKTRLSLAGVQDKLPLLVLDDGFAIGEGEIASTHILKFGKDKERHIVLNEYFCMKLAKECGLNVAEVEIHRFDEEPVLFVQRFDRQKIIMDDSFIVEKKHIIDGCQMLDMNVQSKYEKPYGGENHYRGGSSFKKLFTSTKDCQIKAVAKQELLRWMLFNLCVSNYDSHAKNISFIVNKDGIEVAPFYDIVNIAMYQDVAQEFAMAIGDEFNPKELGAYNLVGFCVQTDLSPRLVKNEFDTMVKKIEKHIIAVSASMQSHGNSEKAFIDEMRNQILTVIAKMKEDFGMLISAHKDYREDFEDNSKPLKDVVAEIGKMIEGRNIAPDRK